MDNPSLRLGGGLGAPLSGGLAPPMPAGLAPPMPAGLMPPMPGAAALQRPIPAGSALPPPMPFGTGAGGLGVPAPAAAASPAAADDAFGRGKRGRGPRGAKAPGGAVRGRRSGATAAGITTAGAWAAAAGRGDGGAPRRARGAGRAGRGARGRGAAAGGAGAGAAGAAGALDDELDNAELEEAPKARGDDEDEVMDATHRGWFAKELPYLMYGFGDAEQPLQASVDLLEDMAVEYITGIVHNALQLGAPRGSGIIGAPGAPKKGEVRLEDVEHVVRHDARKLARVRELLNMQVTIREVRKLADDTELTAAQAAELGDEEEGGAGAARGTATPSAK